MSLGTNQLYYYLKHLKHQYLLFVNVIKYYNNIIYYLLRIFLYDAGNNDKKKKTI